MSTNTMNILSRQKTVFSVGISFDELITVINQLEEIITTISPVNQNLFFNMIHRMDWIRAGYLQVLTILRKMYFFFLMNILLRIANRRKKFW